MSYYSFSGSANLPLAFDTPPLVSDFDSSASVSDLGSPDHVPSTPDPAPFDSFLPFSDNLLPLSQDKAFLLMTDLTASRMEQGFPEYAPQPMYPTVQQPFSNLLAASQSLGHLPTDASQILVPVMTLQGPMLMLTSSQVMPMSLPAAYQSQQLPPSSLPLSTPIPTVTPAPQDKTTIPVPGGAYYFVPDGVCDSSPSVSSPSQLKEQTKRFICPHPECGRAFARNFNMQSHLKSHLNIRDFDCPECPKKFSRRHDRARHCAAVHDLHLDRTAPANASNRRTTIAELTKESERAVREYFKTHKSCKSDASTD